MEITRVINLSSADIKHVSNNKFDNLSLKEINDYFLNTLKWEEGSFTVFSVTWVDGIVETYLDYPTDMNALKVIELIIKN
jgi:hypothetical protein